MRHKLMVWEGAGGPISSVGKLGESKGVCQATQEHVPQPQGLGSIGVGIGEGQGAMPSPLKSWLNQCTNMC